MRVATDPDRLSHLAEGLGGLAGKIDPKLSASLAERIVEAMWASTDPDRLSHLAEGLGGLAGKIDPKLVAEGAERIVEAMRATTDPLESSSLTGGLGKLAGKIDPKLSAPLAENIVKAMRAATDRHQLGSLAGGLFALRKVQSVDRPQVVVDLLKQSLAVMPLESSIFVGRKEKHPRTVMDCLLAYVGRGLRREPVPDLQSFLVWAKAHPEVDLDLESPPELRLTN